ncbi:hypothetical protein [Paludisphaera rhizosphaerae]|uniref:hypothetical protein n=1 Tax=Paludisphaera rhizosphaerae TaxID=2711216 RepID=UPI001980E0CE|nr:hypothetical protein [Paludisphaera rhizosphaerae]
MPLFVLIGGVSVQADAIKPWAGASATTKVFGQTDSRSGATASAIGSDSHLLEFQGYYSAAKVTTSSSASANATGQANNLLEVSGQHYAGDPGTTGTYADSARNISATASWSGDQVIVTPTGDGAPPDSVRLEFALTFRAPGYSSEERWMFGSMQVDANGRTITISPVTSYSSSDGYSTLRVGGEFDSLSISPDIPPESGTYFYLGKFHIDVALDGSGVSDPFNLSLSSLPRTGLFKNLGFFSYQWASLALTGVTLPDGTSLADAGYDVSFASGLIIDEAAVPEPASAACWSLAALGSYWLIRRLRLSRRAAI